MVVELPLNIARVILRLDQVDFGMTCALPTDFHQHGCMIIFAPPLARQMLMRG